MREFSDFQEQKPMEGIFLWVLSCPVLHQTHSAVVGEVTPPSLLPLATVKQLKHAYKPVLSVKFHAKNNNPNSQGLGMQYG